MGDIAMDFDEELKELITAALDTGIDRDTIITALEERANFLTEQEAQAATNGDEDVG
jgi:hypothetical protein